MDYRIVPSVWKVGANVYRRDDIVPEEALARQGSVSSWRRLGFIVPADAPETVWWDGLTKNEIVNGAVARGIELEGKTKRELIAELEALDGV